MHPLRKLFQKIIASVVALIIALNPLLILADEFDDAMAAGRAAGAEIQQHHVFPATDEANKTFTVDGETIDLYELFPDAASGETATLEDVYGRDSDTVNLGVGAQTTLKTEASPTGKAYRLLLDSANTPYPSMANDPILDAQSSALDASTVASLFGDCETVETLVPFETTSHQPDLQTCTRIRDTTGVNTITHDLQAHTVLIEGRVGSYMVCSAVFDLDFVNGTYTLVSASEGLGIQTDGVVPALDYPTLCPAGAKMGSRLAGAYDWPSANVTLTQGGSYDSSYSWAVHQYPTCANGLQARVRITDGGCGEWHKYGTRFAFSLAIVDQDQWPSNPNHPFFKAVADIHSGVCTGTVTCRAYPPSTTVGGQTCYQIGGAVLCPGEIDPSPIAGIDDFCLEAQAISNCDGFWQGALECYTDAFGVKQCPVNTGDGVTYESATGEYSDCQTLKADSSCAFVETQCVEGSEQHGVCYVHEDIYDCGYDVTLTDYQLTKTVDCIGPIRCMGLECVDDLSTGSNSFNQVLGYLQTMNFMARDGRCDSAAIGGTHHDIEAGCTVFGGDPLECKKAVGGIQNCCFNPSGLSLADYIAMLMAIGTIDDLIMGMNSTGLIKGAWTTLREPVVSTWESVKKVWTSATESVLGNSTQATSAGLIEGLQQQAMQVANDFVTQTFGADAASALFQEVKNTLPGGVELVTIEFNPVVQNIISTVMWVYTIYAITKLVVELAFPCEEEEYELSARRHTRVCHYNGSYCKTEVLGTCIEKRKSYCCYNSPLSRIIQEQVKLQGVGSWGTAKHPNCDGLTLPQLSLVDWDAVDFSEWLGILAETGQLPTPNLLNVETLTGSGSTLDVLPDFPDRSNVIERTDQRMDGLDYQAITEEATNELWGQIPDPN